MRLFPYLQMSWKWEEMWKKKIKSGCHFWSMLIYSRTFLRWLGLRGPKLACFMPTQIYSGLHKITLAHTVSITRVHTGLLSPVLACSEYFPSRWCCSVELHYSSLNTRLYYILFLFSFRIWYLWSLILALHT